MTSRQLQLIVAVVLAIVMVQSVAFPQIRPGVKPSVTPQQAYDMKLYRDNKDFENEAWRHEQEMRQMQDVQAAMQAEMEAIRAEKNKRVGKPRKSDPGFVTSEDLNKAIENLQPGQKIDLHGNLFSTVDHVLLSASYYKGADGKESVPIVLLHGKNGSRKDFDALIPELTKQGMAVLVPDLRGHGQSKEVIVTEYSQPPYDMLLGLNTIDPFAQRNVSALQERWDSIDGFARRNITHEVTTVAPYDAKNFEDLDYLAMARFDVELLHDFLVFENNQERLNLNKLVIIGSEYGSAIATSWAKFDWAANSMHQTKAVVLISPSLENIDTGFFNSKALRDGVSFMIIVGQDDEKAVADADKIKEAIVAKKKDNATPVLNQKCPIIPCATNRQGATLFSVKSANLLQGIPYFIGLRLSAIAEEKKLVEWKKAK